MKTRIFVSLLGLWLGVQLAGAQGMTFTYQGRLDASGGLATGNYSFQFQLYSNATVGLPVSSLLTSNLHVSDGLFTTPLDFGLTPFNGRPLWMQIAVAPSNQPPLTPTVLAPRQAVTPAPYAIFANTASNAAANAVGPTSLQDNAVTAPKIRAGEVVKSLNGLRDAVTLSAGANVTITPSGSMLTIAATGGGASAWSLTGNAGTTPGANYLGASDSAQVRLHATGGFLMDNTTPSLSFGATRRQMLNFYNGDFGIGVQDFTLYQRSGNQFVWYQGGTHANSAGDPGPGGLFLMNLDSAGSLFVNGSLVVDRTNANNGGLYPGLIFAPGSGEGISSKRSAGGNQYGIDFYTGFQNRLSILNNGSIGIGTASPEDSILDIEGDTHINDHDIFLRGGGDRSHGLGYRDSAAGQGIDGPFAYGFNGGALGVSGPDSISLKWSWTGDVWVSNNFSTATLDVRGDANISGITRTAVLTITGGADVAEPFHMSEQGVVKGALVIIDEENPGQLKLSDRACDRRVAGIVSGANGIQPGITLQQEGALEGGQNVALSGRVYALADASTGPIKPGDLLTSSATPGHVMRVSDHARAQGAIVGKAMSPLKEGKGMVLVLVSLQ